MSSTLTKVTLPAPGYPWDSQGLIPASGQALLPGQVAPTPTLKWRVVITGLPTHPFLLPSCPKGSLGLHKFSQDTWKIWLAPSPAKFSGAAEGVGIGVECLTFEGSFLLPSEASLWPGTSQPHPCSGAPWGAEGASGLQKDQLSWKGQLDGGGEGQEHGWGRRGFWAEGIPCSTQDLSWGNVRGCRPNVRTDSPRMQILSSQVKVIVVEEMHVRY